VTTRQGTVSTVPQQSAAHSGFNRCGYKARGDPETLCSYAKAHGTKGVPWAARPSLEHRRFVLCASAQSV